MKPESLLRYVWLALASLAALVVVVDRMDMADKVLRVVSRASYELNALATGAKGIESLAFALLALAGTVWLWNRRRP